MEQRTIKISTKNSNLPLKVIPGHFATNHSHINHYLDLTTLKSRLSEADEIAEALASGYIINTSIDTILCLDGMEVISTILAQELTRSGLPCMNAHGTIYVVTPEFNANSQIMFRDNTQPMIKGKNVLVVMASVASGITVRKSMESVSYYGGHVVGVASIFSAVDEVNGIKVNSVFHKDDVPDYDSFASNDCPMCKAGQPIDALVNAFGYSKL